MEPVSRTRNVLVRALLLGVLLCVLRFVYVVTVHGESCDSGDFCFFSSPSETFTIPASAGAAKAFARGGDAAAPSPKWSSKEWQEGVRFYSSVFQDLIMEGFVSPGSKSLSIGSAAGYEVFALKEIGVLDSIGIARKKAPPLVVSGDPHRLQFTNDTFDFVFVGVGMVETSKFPADLASEIQRALKPDWFLVVHTSSAGDGYSLSSLTSLFHSCKLVQSREIPGLGTDLLPIQEIVFRKEVKKKGSISRSGTKNKCSIAEQKLELVKKAEPLIKEEPLKPWMTLKRNVKNIKYLPSMADISFKRRYIYVDIGARSYGSSIGSWFKKQYPKQNRTFEIYAIEADKAFHDEYRSKKGIELLPFAAWVRNETLSFEINHDHDVQENEGKGRGMGRIQPASSSMTSADVHAIQGFDFAEWLKSTVSEKDFVVMKMDVEGTEFDLIPRLFETGAFCLVDELFLECHYNRWQKCCPGERSPKYPNTYGQCLELFSSLRKNGVLVHQWW